MGSEPTFSHLADFLEKGALIANTEFGKLVGFKLGESRVTKQPRKVADADGTVLALTQVEKDVSNQANTANSKLSNQRSATDGQVKCKFAMEDMNWRSVLSSGINDIFKGRTFLGNKICVKIV